MRKFILSFALVVISGSTYAFSCLPPDFNSDPDECSSSYYTLEDVENTIHGLKSLSPEGKDFIVNEVHLRKRAPIFNLNLRVFSEELCVKSKKQGVNLFKNTGRCPVEILSYSLYPGDEIVKVDGSLEVDIKVGNGGGFDGATIRGRINF